MITRVYSVKAVKSLRNLYIQNTFKGLFNWPGGYSIRETPDSIPNSEVKPNSADGTTS